MSAQDCSLRKGPFFSITDIHKQRNLHYYLANTKLLLLSILPWLLKNTLQVYAAKQKLDKLNIDSNSMK